MPYDSQPMQNYRGYINESVETLGVHGRLICYWDQSWVLLQTPEAKIVRKHPSLAGVKSQKSATLNKEAVKMAILREFDFPRYQEEVNRKGDSHKNVVNK